MHKGDEGSPLADDPRSPKHEDTHSLKGRVGSYFDLASAVGEVKATPGVLGDKHRVTAFLSADADIMMDDCGCEEDMDDDTDIAEHDDQRSVRDLMDPLEVNFS